MSATQDAKLARADRVLAGGALNVLDLPEGRRLIAARAAGSRLWDAAGGEYIDLLMGSGPLILGHAHPHVAEAVSRQLSSGSTYYLLSEPAIELAERLAEIVPCAERTRFCTTGSEAVFFAMRLARASTGRDKVLKCEGAFHGNSDYALMSLSPTAPPAFPQAHPSSSGIPASLAGEVLVGPYNDVEAIERIVAEHGDTLAAIVVEPVQRAIPPVPGFLHGLREITTRHGIVLIFDEVVTGFRLALGGAQEHYGVTPDLVALGKILGGGLPLAAVSGRADIMEQISRGAYFSGTLGGSPVSCAAALATLDVLSTAGVYPRLHEAGERLQRSLETTLRTAGHDALVYGVGPMFQIHFGEDAPTDYRSATSSDKQAIARFAAAMLDRGILMTGKKAYLSLAHSDEDLDAIVAAAG